MHRNALYKAMFEHGANATVKNGYALVGGFQVSLSGLHNLIGMGNDNIRDMYPNYTAHAGDTIRRNASNLIAEINREARENQKEENGENQTPSDFNNRFY